MNKQIVLLFVLVYVGALTWWLVKKTQQWYSEYENKYVEIYGKELSGLFLTIDPRMFVILNVALTIFFFVIGYLSSGKLFYAIFWGAIGFLLPRIALWYMKKRRLEQFEGQLIDSLVIISNALRSGMNLVQALEMLVNEQDPPVSQEFRMVLNEYAMGVKIEDALNNLTIRMPNEDLKIIVTATNIVYGMGGNLLEIYDTMLNVIRERTKLEKKTKALTAQGKLQGIVVGLLPTFLGLMFFLLDPSAMMLMFTNFIGNIAFGVMITLQLIGYIFVRKLTTIEI